MRPDGHGIVTGWRGAGKRASAHPVTTGFDDARYQRLPKPDAGRTFLEKPSRADGIILTAFAEMIMKTHAALSPDLDSKLSTYAAMAGANHRSLATGAAMSALAIGALSIIPCANAEIACTVTNKTIEGPYATMQIDLNNDGVADFYVGAGSSIDYSSGTKYWGDLYAQGLQGAEILDNHSFWALAYNPGHAIGSQSGFRTDGGMASCFFNPYSRGSNGFWLHAQNRFLGVKFSFSGETHYGWARFNAGCAYAQLTAYAYETVPDRPIIAGACMSVSTLGALARGAQQK